MSIEITSVAAATMKSHGKFSRGGGEIFCPPPSRHLLLLVSWCSVCINQSEYFLYILQYLFHLIAAINIYKGIKTTFSQGWIHWGRLGRIQGGGSVHTPPQERRFSWKWRKRKMMYKMCPASYRLYIKKFWSSS